MTLLVPQLLLHRRTTSVSEGGDTVSIIFFFSCWNSSAESKPMRLFAGLLWWFYWRLTVLLLFQKSNMNRNNNKLWTQGKSFSSTHIFCSDTRAFSQGGVSAFPSFWCALYFIAAHWLTQRKKKKKVALFCSSNGRQNSKEHNFKASHKTWSRPDRRPGKLLPVDPHGQQGFSQLQRLNSHVAAECCQVNLRLAELDINAYPKGRNTNVAPWS